MDVQLRQLQTLVAVVDAGTFTDAATVLGVSQAAVSRSIGSLEAVLGTRLLQRTTRHVALTGTGNRVLTHARRILDEVAVLRQVAQESRTELRVGYAWAALGKHTRRLQKHWAAAHPRVPLVFVQANSPTAGLSEGIADVAVIRRPFDDSPFDDRRFASTLVGVEARYAAVATDNALARRRTLRLADLARYTVAIDTLTGTTTTDLWPTAPTIRATHGLDEWLTLIAAGQAVGLTSEATANQNPRPGIAFRTVRDAPPIPVRLAWWKDDPPAYLSELVRMAAEAYRSAASPRPASE